MGNWTYCRKCRIPVKEFDYENSMICGHNDSYRGNRFFNGSDHEERLKIWNKYFPDRPATYDMAMAHVRSPYEVNEFGVFLEEIEEILNPPNEELNPWYNRHRREKI